jgi:ABC-type branched-subunit amino acid transport system ATPase component
MSDGLEIRGLSKRFGNRPVISGLDLDVAARSIRCIVGPNGSGKSTLLNLIDGQLQPDLGTIVVGSRPLTATPPHRRRWLGVSRAFQVPRLMSSLTVKEHLVLADLRDRRELSAVLRAADGGAKELPAAWKRLGLDRFADVTAAALSHAHRKLLDVALALVGRSSLLLLDEPTAGLDDPLIALVREVIVDYARSATVLLVEHNLAFVGLLGCPVSFLHGGRILRTGTLDEVRADPIATDVYLHAG